MTDGPHRIRINSARGLEAAAVAAVDYAAAIEELGGLPAIASDVARRLGELGREITARDVQPTREELGELVWREIARAVARLVVTAVLRRCCSRRDSSSTTGSIGETHLADQADPCGAARTSNPPPPPLPPTRSAGSARGAEGRSHEPESQPGTREPEDPPA